MFGVNARSNYFDLKLLEYEELPSETIDGSRVYTTPKGDRYPSVTTILSSMKAKQIAEWRSRVGEEKANKISSYASSRGTKVHNILEKYVQNDEDFAKGAMPTHISMFNTIRGYLDNYCDEIYGIECPLYSDRLRTAGRCDLIGRIHGIRTIGDFKTSTNVKKEEWIDNYFYQCTAYALMLQERHGLWCPQICVMIATENDGLQTFVKQTKQFVEPVEQYFTRWHQQRDQQ